MDQIEAAKSYETKFKKAEKALEQIKLKKDRLQSKLLERQNYFIRRETEYRKTIDEIN